MAIYSVRRSIQEVVFVATIFALLFPVGMTTTTVRKGVSAVMRAPLTSVDALAVPKMSMNISASKTGRRRTTGYFSVFSQKTALVGLRGGDSTSSDSSSGEFSPANEKNTPVIPTGGDGKVVGMAVFGSIVALFRRFSHIVGQSKRNCWVVLFVSIIGEAYATSLSKQAKESGSALTLCASLVIYMMTMLGFNLSLAKIEVGIAYAVWSAWGTILVTAVGIVFFRESCDLVKLSCLALIVAGVVGLNLR